MSAADAQREEFLRVVKFLDNAGILFRRRIDGMAVYPADLAEFADIYALDGAAPLATCDVCGRKEWQPRPPGRDDICGIRLADGRWCNGVLVATNQKEVTDAGA